MSYRDSLPVVGTLELMGVWVHDPDDPEGTIQSYPYGAALRERTVDTKSAGTYYAGRTYPVVDHGEHEAEVTTWTAHIPHGPTWRTAVERSRDLASVRRTMVYRDNRGRATAGVLGDYREADQSWGTSVSFAVTRVDVPAPDVGIL